MNVSERLRALAAELGEVSATDPAHARGDTVFAVADGPAVELRLGPEIADAAQRTPDTALSERGDNWVRFAPREWDKHATDRLEAWYRVAWRLAGNG